MKDEIMARQQKVGRLLIRMRTLAERQRAMEVLRHYAERLETLHQIDRAIAEAQSPEAIAQATLARIGRLVPCRHASIVAFGAESDPPTILTVHAEPDAVADQTGPEAGREGAEGAGRGVDIPLTAQGELIGILRIESGKGNAFTSEQVETVYEISTPLAAAIQNARLHQRLQRHAGNLEETVNQRTRELKAERDRTQAILESLGEAVIVSDVEGTVLYTNSATSALTGFAGEEALGKSWWALQGDGPSSETYAQVQSAIGERRAWRGEMTSRRKDGSAYYAEVTVTPLLSPDGSGKLSGTVWVQRDISPLKTAERMKDEFVSNVSHELRTPLSVLTLVTGNLARLYDRLDDARRKGMVLSIREQVALLNDLVADVLEVSRIDSGGVSTEHRQVDLALLVREEADKQRPLARAKAQTLQVVGLETLPVQGNDSQLRQIISNLVANACKFTPQGGQITCECCVQGGAPLADASGDYAGSFSSAQGEVLSSRRWAVLRVIDTGIGVEEEDIPRLFERFFRVKTEGNVPGTGLGLSIARELVELGGGHIGVASTPGKGSVFAVFLPLQEEHTHEGFDLGR